MRHRLHPPRRTHSIWHKREHMDPYRHGEPQTLGDVLARMKPLPEPPSGASDEERVRAQAHNDALAQLKNNAVVARALAQNTITRGGPFPDSLLHFVPSN